MPEKSLSPPTPCSRIVAVMPHDPSLSDLLRTWDVPTGIPRDFRRGVWTRIGRRTGDSMPLAERWISLLALPRFAAAAAACALFAGILAGGLQARSDGEALYLRSVDPLALHARGR